MDIQAIMDRQQAIAVEVSEIRFMQKGSISLQRMPSAQGGTQAEAMRGPYPILTWKEAGRTRSLRLKSKDEVAWAEQAVANHRRFAALCKEYQELGERIAHELRRTPQDAASEEAVKKGLKSRSSKARKSPG